MEMGYELEEIVVEVNQQAETGKRYTLDSVHAALRKQNL